MDVRIFVEPQQGTTYSAVAHLARHAERLGFEGFFTSDHLLAMGDANGMPGPLDAWTTLAGLSRDTVEIRLGTLVTPVTFRQPGLLAVTVAQVDHMSDGRVELGLGAGWFDAEHAAHGIAFPPLGERFDRLADALELITAHWDLPLEETRDHAAGHYPVSASPGLPKPVQHPHPPIIMGGYGARRTPALAARYADEFNLPFADPDGWQAQCDVVRDAVASAGREAHSMRYSVAQVACVGRTEAEFARRSLAINRDPDELRANGVCGLPHEAAARLAAFRDRGADRLYLQVLDIADLDHLDLLAEIAGV